VMRTETEGPVSGVQWDSFAFEHCLTLQVGVTQHFIGQVPGGYRVDFYYSGELEGLQEPADTALAAARKYPALDSPSGPFSSGLRDAINAGTILSGADWVTINSRAVLDFDSRITIALKTPKKGLLCPVAGRLRGRVQLVDAMKAEGGRYFRNRSEEEVLAVWKAGFDEDSWLPLVLSASFEVPILGFSEEQTELYKEARRLGDSLFIGLGRATFRKASYGAVKSIKLELHKLSGEPATSPAAGAAQ